VSGQRQPTVAVVVVTYNAADTLPGLVASLPAGLAGLAYRLIVVDNDSHDDSVAVARRLAPNATVLATGVNAGYSAGINKGLAVAGEYDAAFVLNPDIRLGPGCGARLYAALSDEVGIAAPLIRHENGTVAYSQRREPTVLRAFGEAVLGQRAGRIPRLGETVQDEAAYRDPRATDWATGAAMLISAACLSACGPWDESFFLYSEETDYALRARDRGYLTWFVPDAEAVHLGGESRVSPRLWSLLTVNRVRLYRKRHTRPATALYWSAVLLRESSRALLGQPRARQATVALLRRSSPEQWRRPTPR
jgi:N-acetylglucosaminyl-diphospho-decaprenol L-rhamnosyltransferase